MADSKIRLNQIQQDGASTGQFIRFDGTNWANSSVLLDNALSIANSTNTTKLAQFDASAISASTTRTYILPNASGTLALLSDITTAPAGTNYNLQYYNSGDLGADSNITVTPGANPKLGIGTSSPAAALHGKSWNDVGSPVILAENNSANDILAILSSGYIKLGDNESYPRFFSSTSNGTKSYTGQGFTFEGSFVVSSTTEIFSIGTPATDLSTGSYKILEIGGTFSPSTAATSTLSIINLTTTINQTSVTSGITRGINIAPASVTNLQDFRAVEIAINNSVAKGIYQTGSSTVNNFVGNTSFGTTTAPNATNLIDIVSTTKSLGLPAMTSTQRNAISSPRDGSVVYNSTDNAVSVRANSAWVNLGNGIYNGSGSIASSTVATLGTNISFRINYSNANAGLLINDTTNSVLISSRDGNKFLSADNTSVLIGDGATRMEYVGGVLRLYDSDATQYVGLQTPTTGNLTTSYTLTLPTSAGTNNSALTTNGSGTLTWRAVLGRAPIVGTTASSATPTPNADTDDVFTVTALSTGATFGAPTGTPSNGQRLTIRIKDNGSGQTLAYNAIYRAVGVTLPTTTVASKTIYLTMIYNSADTKWDVIAFSQEA